LDILRVPYTVAIAQRPAHRSARTTPPIGWSIRTTRADLGALCRWMPSLEKAIAALGPFGQVSGGTEREAPVSW
jgi:hypothetical protein